MLVADSLINVGDAEVGGAAGDDAGIAAGDDRYLDAGSLEQHDAEPVLDVEGLQFVAVVGVVQAAVGHHAVDVEGDELDAGGAGFCVHQMTLALKGSGMFRAPIRWLSASTTSRPLMRRRSIISTASTARRSGPMVCGPGCITEAISPCCRSMRFSKARRRSPSVKMPMTALVGSMIATRPSPPRDMATMASVMAVVGATAGTLSPARMTSRTWVSRRRPSEPPGCERAKSSGPKPRASSSATAKASPSASAAGVLAVGARLCGQASCAPPASRWISASRASVDDGTPVISMPRAPWRLTAGTIRSSSSDSPELERASRMPLRG